jgi:P22 coat protein - gene protein 5
MANSLSSITTGIIFFGREVLAQLQNKLVLVPRCWGDYSGASAAPGQTVRVPDLTISGDAAVRAIGDDASASDVSSGYTDVTVNQIYQAVQYDNIENLMTNVDLRNEFASRLAYKVAKAADAQVAALWSSIGNEVGTLDGTSAFASTLGSLSDARKVLMDYDAPMENLSAVFCPSEGNALRHLTQLTQVNTSGTGATLRSGELLPLFGFDVFESQQIADVTEAAAAAWGTSPLVNKSAGYAVGATSIDVDGLGTGSIAKGSSFLLKGYYYVVTEAASISGNAATLKINPPLRAAVANNDPLTAQKHSAEASMNLAFNRDAFVCVGRTPTPFIGPGVSQTIVTDEQTGLSLRIAVESHIIGSPGYTETIAADLVFGVSCVRPEWACKVSGKV